LIRSVEKALERVEPSPRGHEATVVAVHEARKDFKKVRAALRLLREMLGDEAYRETNFAFRDAARPLTRVRDAQMLVATLDGVVADDPLAAPMREALLENERELSERVLRHDHAFAVVRDFARRALEAERLRPASGDALGLAHGLRRVYRNARRAFARANENPSVENLHEWRKQTKYLWHALRLMEASEELSDAAHELSRVLGDDHDLAVLRRALAADPTTFGGHARLKALFARIDAKRLELEQRAFALGQLLFAVAPAAFAARAENVAAGAA
jgi:CHAD domain-containing protein